MIPHSEFGYPLGVPHLNGPFVLSYLRTPLFHVWRLSALVIIPHPNRPFVCSRMKFAIRNPKFEMISGSAFRQRYSVGEQARRLLKLIATNSAEEMRNQVEFVSVWG